MPPPSSKRAILSENEDNLDRPEASSTSTQRKKKHRRGPCTEVTPEDILPPDTVRLRKRSAKQKETENNAETATQKKLHKALQELAVLKRQVRVKNHVLTTEIRQRSIERADGSNDEHKYESEDGMESKDPSSYWLQVLRPSTAVVEAMIVRTNQVAAHSDIATACPLLKASQDCVPAGVLLC
ncbi:hypothetical protein BC835DRAFT_1310970 [Cytidiella melzeri]|nr:hypothetical protein BC835DRAFT_1310970 [Cytidiella melzeri]